MNEDSTRKIPATDPADETRIFPEDGPAAGTAEETTVLPEDGPVTDSAEESPVTQQDAEVPAFSPLVTAEEVPPAAPSSAAPFASGNGNAPAEEVPPAAPSPAAPFAPGYGNAPAEEAPPAAPSPAAPLNPGYGSAPAATSSAPSTAAFPTNYPASEPPCGNHGSEVKFGLLAWGLVVTIIGCLTLLAPAAPVIDWGAVLVIVFALLGVLMLVLAGITVWQDRRRKRR